jgi:hypothetical protein
MALGDLARIPILTKGKSRAITPENPTGAVGAGAKAEPDGTSPARNMGRGWKVRPNVDLPPGETVIADIEGPGTITHIWLTCWEGAYRGCNIRMYWDDDSAPAVDAPLGDFFACGHGLRYPVNSVPVAVNPTGGFNSYWPMPFARRARIVIDNTLNKPVRFVYYQVDYELDDLASDAGRFHAAWNMSTTDPVAPDHTILDITGGPGHYVGTFLAWTQQTDPGWWGEGEVKFFIDGDGGSDDPTICGTGTEDYVGGAWSFGSTYSTPFLGYPFGETEGDLPRRHALYRWHLPDPVRFTSSLRVTVQAIGWYPGFIFQPLADEVGSVAYWYQAPSG